MGPFSAIGSESNGYETIPVANGPKTKNVTEGFESKTARSVKASTWWKIACAMLGCALLVVVAFSGFHVRHSGQVTVQDSPILGISHSSSLPDFHQVLAQSSSMASYLYSNQIQYESSVKDGVIYTRQHPGARAESGFSQVLAVTMPKFDKRFNEGIHAYWTFQIRLARVNSGSKWHSYAKNLPTGIQTIKRKAPTRWQGERVTSWSSVKSFKVIVY